MRTTRRASGIAMPAATAVLLATSDVAVAAGGTGFGDTEAERAVPGLLEAVDRLRTHPVTGAESLDAAQTQWKGGLPAPRLSGHTATYEHRPQGGPAR
ncbi:hypothetical protein [Streptomyces coelicoflavus]|uniref:hypothetical protein n=1 Tax=Streptomyces coelicoflavus TaxID=285562 RepID=UPI003A84F0E9